MVQLSLCVKISIKITSFDGKYRLIIAALQVIIVAVVRADRTTNSRPDRDLCRHRDRTPGAIECILSNQYDRTPDQKFSAGSTIVLGREFTLQTRF
jgi:hypothetical protein